VSPDAGLNVLGLANIERPLANVVKNIEWKVFVVMWIETYKLAKTL